MIRLRLLAPLAAGLALCAQADAEATAIAIADASAILVYNTRPIADTMITYPPLIETHSDGRATAEADWVRDYLFDEMRLVQSVTAAAVAPPSSSGSAKILHDGGFEFSNDAFFEQILFLTLFWDLAAVTLTDNPNFETTFVSARVALNAGGSAPFDENIFGAQSKEGVFRTNVSLDPGESIFITVLTDAEVHAVSTLIPIPATLPLLGGALLLLGVARRRRA